jgi:3-deoxy-D-manno-octulosonate 8-phosphate phosphatase (KDO 8-P phosphatase)
MDTTFYVKDKNGIPEPRGKYANIKYVVIDVDGTMTDAGIYYDDNGNELKKFCTKDAAGFFAAKVCGIKILVLTGRKCNATSKRMKELNVDFLEQNIVNKVEYLTDFMKQNNVKKEELAYIGDDLNDYQGMQLAGFVGCPQDSADEIIAIADYVSTYKGGYGAVRGVMHYILSNRGQWNQAIKQCYKIGI